MGPPTAVEHVGTLVTGPAPSAILLVARKVKEALQGSNNARDPSKVP
jgi:hypothetical protein